MVRTGELIDFEKKHNKALREALKSIENKKYDSYNSAIEDLAIAICLYKKNAKMSHPDYDTSKHIYIEMATNYVQVIEREKKISPPAMEKLFQQGKIGEIFKEIANKEKELDLRSGVKK